MRWAFSVVILAACGDDGGAPRPDAVQGMACQVDADCGALFCNANVCGPRPMWNAPTKLGGDVPFDGANQVGATIRSDNLEIVYASNRSGSTLAIDLWHAQRSTATADCG